MLVVCLILSCDILPAFENGNVAMLDELCQAIHFKGDFTKYQSTKEEIANALGDTGHGSLCLGVGGVGRVKSIQGLCYNLFKASVTPPDISRVLAAKICVTVGPVLKHQICLPVDWYDKVQNTLKSCSPHLCSCVFKTWIGGWTTSHRMHEPTVMQCFFGCVDEQDTLMHYMQCAPLWLLAGEALQCTPPFSIAKRLCIDEPTPEQVRLLALCFQGYHYAKSLCEAEGERNSRIQNSRNMQAAVQQAMKAFAASFC
jgi:hypothetical protein